MTRNWLVLLALVLLPCAAPAQTITMQGQLDNAFKAESLPVESVSFGSLTDKATWSVIYRPGATQPQKDRVAAIITAFNVADPALPQLNADAKTDAAFNDVIDDVLTALIEQWPAMQADATAGTLSGNTSLYKQRIRSRVRALRRAKPPSP